MPANVRFGDVSLRFGDQEVLAGIELSIDAGQFVSLVGPSGCGKTSLLRLAAGLVAPSSGVVQVEAGGRVPSLSAARLAYVFQEPRLLPWRNVIENIALPLELQGRSRQDRQAIAYQAMRRVGLDDADRGKFPWQLSGGMQMRVSLARALVTAPDVLLLDEPFAALDDLLRQQMNEQLLQLWQQDGWTAIFVTHNVAEAVYLSQRVVVLCGKPARVVEEVLVPFEYPRSWSLRNTAAFSSCCGQVAACLRNAGICR
ncbi:MAG: nitrate/sulfonate/bicarbonate ABC transporter ATP-binding protein [Pirellulaceae bacterium]|nr:MAG: nitrate/sulfonate/bicarbonate ABC transporter ATP-binding protein [Pirellulaceae bacterium]